MKLSAPSKKLNFGLTWRGKNANNAINADVQKRRFALLLHAGYGERYKSRKEECYIWTRMQEPIMNDLCVV